MASRLARTPRDIRIATWANAGLGPVYHRELSRMEMDPVAASTVAAAALEYLGTGKYPEGTVIGPRWVRGETIGTAPFQCVPGGTGETGETGGDFTHVPSVPHVPLVSPVPPV